ncbi:M56 family metallopeptidase [Flavobacteriaceae bacterium XHP0103]|uniref:M56 family metallopeptidase n=1 Tax=Marixanthotalea marina TaxID=2844359 RepID=UPI002989D1B4|nr:M56 family metallopeptidase [Marixanthotalea marina]MBU3822005.1 M56 family metallopeptidase [Marixanthotalea marina]
MIHYIIQVAAFQMAFLLIYNLFLKKETFFNWNRLYLLATAVLSLIIPFIKIGVFKDVMPKEYVLQLPAGVIGNVENANQVSTTLETVNEQSQSIWTLENLLYAGMVFMALLFAFKLFKVVRLLWNNPKTKFGDLHIVNVLRSNTAFSFFRYVFLGEQLKEDEKNTIFAHEKVHVEENHTLDLLFFEVLRILFWFNPFVYMYQNRITVLHEFIADQQAVKEHGKTQYYENLLAQVFANQNISFINPFFKESLIKKRIVMLQKSKSKQINLLKYTLLLPIVVGMLVYTSCDRDNREDAVIEVVEEQPSSLGNEQKTASAKEGVVEAVPFAVVENVPVFSGCEDLTSKDEQKKCFSDNITNFIQQNFNKDLPENLGLTGVMRTTVMFKINTEGNIEDIIARAPHPDIETEVKRVLQLLPKMMPAKQKDKKVTTKFIMPIISQIKDGKIIIEGIHIIV